MASFRPRNPEFTFDVAPVNAFVQRAAQVHERDVQRIAASRLVSVATRQKIDEVMEALHRLDVEQVRAALPRADWFHALPAQHPQRLEHLSAATFADLDRRLQVCVAHEATRFHVVSLGADDAGLFEFVSRMCDRKRLDLNGLSCGAVPLGDENKHFQLDASTSLFSLEESDAFGEWSRGPGRLGGDVLADFVFSSLPLPAEGAAVHAVLPPGVAPHELPSAAREAQALAWSMLTMYRVLRRGGSYVARVSDLASPWVVGLVFVLLRTFDHVCLYKPDCDRFFASGEVYVVAKELLVEAPVNVVDRLKTICSSASASAASQAAQAAAGVQDPNPVREALAHTRGSGLLPMLQQCSRTIDSLRLAALLRLLDAATHPDTNRALSARQKQAATLSALDDLPPVRGTKRNGDALPDGRGGKKQS